MNEQKGNTFLIIAIIVGVVAIGIVGFALGKYFGGGSELEKNGNEITKPLIEKEIIPKIEKEVEEFEEEKIKIEPKNETANWKIYRNREYGYEIKYPKDWNYSKDVLSDWFGKKFVKNDNEFTCSFNVSMILTEKFDDYMESYYQKTPKLIKVNINGIPALKEGELPNFCNYWIKKQSESKYSFQITQVIEKIITDKNGNKVSYGYVNDSECTDILSKMLSTFKFTD